MSDYLENSESEPSIYSISLGEDGKLKLTRRDFLKMALVVGGALMLTGCQAAQTEQATQTSTEALPPIHLLAQPETGSKVVETLRANDIVALISDRRDLGWVQVASQGGQIGWLSRNLVDFTRAFTPEAGSNIIFNLPAGTPAAAGAIFLVLTVQGAPTSTLPVTCPQYTVTTPIPTTMQTPGMVDPGTATPTLPASLIVGPITVNPCVLVGNVPCGCVSYNPCVSFATCSILNCGCVTFVPCGCVSYIRSCTCVAYFPCSCLSYNPCSCLTYFWCSLT